MSNQHTTPRDGLIKLPEVLKLFPVSKSHWYQGIKELRFPRPVRLSKRAVAWSRAAVLQLVADAMKVAA